MSIGDWRSQVDDWDISCQRLIAEIIEGVSIRVEERRLVLELQYVLAGCRFETPGVRTRGRGEAVSEHWRDGTLGFLILRQNK